MGQPDAKLVRAPDTGPGFMMSIGLGLIILGYYPGLNYSWWTRCVNDIV